MNPWCRPLALSVILAAAGASGAAEPVEILNLWPQSPPGERTKVGPEQDVTKKSDGQPGGRPVIRLGNVTTPQVYLFQPPPEKRTGAAVVICPGGGFHILAWDLEGTEVAEWLNTLGVTAVVLKYRVPSGQGDTPWLSAVQDAQRALSVTRANAVKWGIDPQRIGVLGFSAGGFAAGHVAMLHEKRLYDPHDDADKVSFRPDFGALIYPAYFVNAKTGELKPEFAEPKNAPPLFFVHTEDDPVTCESSVQLFLALKKAKVPAELHVYGAGGHGYGLRPEAKFTVTAWPKRCEEWLASRGLLKAK